MSSWLDQPATNGDQDSFDLVINASQRFFAKHFSLLTKIGPPLLGFSIFLFYFNQHHFYPSFDLFQFSSLLLAAAVLGFVLVGGYVAALLLPGAWMHYGFLNSASIKEDIRYIRPYREDQHGRFAALLIALLYVLPFVGSAVATSYVLIQHSALLSPAFFLVPLLILLLCGLILQKRFELKRFSFLNFMFHGYVPTLCVVFLGMLTIKDVATRIETLPSAFTYLAVFGIPMLISLAASMCALAFTAGWNAALHFCTFFALGIAAFSGALTSLPDQTIRSLGLGNYQARIILEEGYCDTSTRSTLLISHGCALESAHVVWLMGDSLIFKRSADSTQLIQVPSRFIKAVIREPKNESR